MDDAPRLLRGEAKQRGLALKHLVAEQGNRRLRRAPGWARSRRRVQPVLENVEVEPAQFLRAESLELLHDRMELESFVGCGKLGEVGMRDCQRMPIELEQLSRWNRILSRIEVRRIRQQ